MKSITWDEGGPDLVRNLGAEIGLGCFETMRLNDAGPVLFNHHWERLEHGCGVLGLPIPDRDRILDEMKTMGPGRGRLTITGLASEDHRRRDPPGGVRVRIAVEPLVAWKDPIDLALVDHPVAHRHPFATVKWVGRVPEHLEALKSAEALGADECVRTNYDGIVTECAYANLIWTNGGQLETPALSTGCLPGVIRTVFLPRTTEVTRTPEQFIDGLDGLWITSATRPITAVDRIFLDGEWILVPWTEQTRDLGKDLLLFLNRAAEVGEGT